MMEGSVTKRNDGRWQGVVDVPTITSKRIRKYVYAASRVECKRKLNELIEEIENDGVYNPGKITFSQFSKTWLDVYCISLSPTTLNGYKKYIKYASVFIGDSVMSKILPIHIQGLINEFSKTHSEKSSSNLYGAVNGVFKYALMNRVMKYNPCEGVKIPKDTDRYQYYIYTELEYSELVSVVIGSIEEVPILLAGLCGLRVSEIMGLTWNDIDFKTGVIHIRKANVNVNGTVIEKNTKTRTSYRDIVASPIVIDRLLVYKGVGYIYSKADGSPENGGNYGKRFSRILKNAKLPHTRFHDLRHFNATMMLKYGVLDKVAAGRLGHADINMTKKYQHVLSNMDKGPADILNNIITIKDVKLDVKTR